MKRGKTKIKISLILLVAIFLIPSVYGDVLCTYGGFDVSEHDLQLSDFNVSGDKTVNVGDKISASFMLKYVGKTSATFDDKYGVFVAAKDPDGKRRTFGNTYQGKTLKSGDFVDIETDVTLDKDGEWVLWASYCIKEGKETKCGPEGWHACNINVEPKEALPTDCPEGCDCLTEAQAKELGYVYCEGVKVICGYIDQYQNPMYCYEKPVVTPTPEGKPTITPPGLPDFVITDILCDEPEGRIGYKIKNVGDGVAPAGHETALLVDSELLDEDKVDISLAPGDTYRGYFESYNLSKSVGIAICADHYDEVAEAAEDNNCRWSECVVREEEDEEPPSPTELLPNLIVDRYRSISYYATTPERLGFYYRIWNVGSAPAPATWTQLYIDGRRIAEQRVDPLDAGERRDERIEVLWDCTLCTDDRIEFRLDARDEVAEEYEVNHNYFVIWTCSYRSLPDIDLVAEGIHFDPTDDKIKYTLSNRGAGESLETESHLYIDGEEVESRHIAQLAAGESREEYFNYEWRCTRNEDTIRVVVDSVIRVVEDCSGVEVGLGEPNIINNWAEVTWECELPDLIIEDISVDGDTVNYIITNQGNFTAGPTTTSLRFYEPSSEYGIWARGDLIDQCSDRVAELAPGESREESISAPCSCSPPIVHISLKADEGDSVIETYENNFLDFYWQCGVRGACDLSVERVWLEDRSRVCYEIMNLGSIASESTTTEIDLDSSCSFYRGHISHEEPELPAGQSRTVCLDISSSEPVRFDGTYCGCKRLEVDVETAPELYADPRNPHSNNILNAIFDNDNPCADGIQNHGEEGIDCGGPCPASCRDCFADATFGRAEDAGYFCLNRVIVHNTARDALEEYANCLRDPVCRATLPVTDPLMSFATVTADDLERSTDYIMEAVAYYVDIHTQYMFDDDDCDICDPGGGLALEPEGAINAEDMIQYSGERSGTISGDVHVDTCPNDYCGDCEDHAILREALMRSLGVSWRCAFCADHYNRYWGDGHTFNLVYYRNKWRIMDYGPLGSYFSEYWDQHNPNNVWNDRVGEYWCPDWRSDPACWYCCNHDPYSYTQNYNNGDACCLGSQDTYIERCAP